jgi:hypothetical protein
LPTKSISIDQSFSTVSLTGPCAIRRAAASVAVAAFAIMVPTLHAQAVASLELPATPGAVTNSSTAADLPDAPGSVDPTGMSSSSSTSVPLNLSTAPLYSAAGGAFGGQGKSGLASVHATVIQSGQTAPRLTVGQKMTNSFISSVSYTAIAGWVISAGYEQATNGSPNYPQTGKGFAQRLGAASARATSETVFGNGVIAAVTHEDPRYYRMGPGHNFFKRLVYAGTRPLLTRTDGGRSTINIWDLGGDLSGAALTPVYYPPLNRSGTEVLKTFGGSVGGDALGFLASEFLPGILTAVHLEHKD